MEKLVCIANSLSSFLPNRLVLKGEKPSPAPATPEGAKAEKASGAKGDAKAAEAAANVKKEAGKTVARATGSLPELELEAKRPEISLKVIGKVLDRLEGKVPAQTMEYLTQAHENLSGKYHTTDIELAFVDVIRKTAQQNGLSIDWSTGRVSREGTSEKPDVGMAIAKSPLIERGGDRAASEAKKTAASKGGAEKREIKNSFDTRSVEARANATRTYLKNMKIDSQNFLAALKMADPMHADVRLSDNEHLVGQIERVQDALGVPSDGVFGPRTRQNLDIQNAEAYALLLGKKPAEKSAAQPAKPEAKKEVVTLERTKVWETTAEIKGERVADGGKETLPSGRQVYVESMAPYGESAIVVTADGLRLKIPGGTLKRVTDANDRFIDIYAINVKNEGKDVRIV